MRRFEERCAEMYQRAKIGGYCHLNLGEEATVVGLMAALEPRDYLFTNYREHGYALAKGIEPGPVMAELFGKATGVSRGRGGSMHLFDVGARLLGGYAIVGGQIPLATGAAQAIAYRDGDEVVMCQMGDGTVNTGAFHECLNMAQLWKLPIVFVIVNNLTGMGTKVEAASAEPELYKRACAYKMASERVDGNDLYVTVAAGGYLGTAPVTALRQISLGTGAQRMIRPHGHSFAGALSGAFHGVVIFSGASGVTAYSGATGQRLWARAQVVPGSVDEVQGRLYLTKGSTLLGVNPQTGARNRRRVAPGASGLYGVRNGVALGLDQGPEGGAWGYDVARKRVVWTSPQLPWPHYFVDLSGLGGSADGASSIVLVTSCARLGATRTAAGGRAGSAGQPAQAGQACLRPELVAIQR